MSTTNPYQAPRSAMDAPLAARDIELAGNWRRFFTYLVDYTCYLLICVVIGMVIGVLFGRQGLAVMNRMGLWIQVIGLGLMLAYYIFFEGFWGRTPGKFVCGTVVVNEQGGRPSWGQIVGRTFTRFVPFEPFSMFSERAWHDAWPHTHVVMAR